MIIIFVIVLLFAGSIHPGLIPNLTISNLNETETSQPLVIYNSNNETMINGTHSSSIEQIDKNQFAETVVDLLLDLLEKANLSRTVSVIHNETELSELVERDDPSKQVTTTIEFAHP